MELFLELMTMIAAFMVSIFGGSWKLSAISLGLGMAVVFLITLAERWRRAREIDRLLQYLMRIQDQPELPELSRYREGRLSTLQSEIYKMASHLSEESDSARREKRYLSDMLSDISHQVKTPITAITIMTDLLKNPDLSEEKRLEFVSNIDFQVSRITWLIKNLLTLSQLEAGVLKLKKENISVKELLEQAIQPFEIMAEVREIDLSCQMEEELWLSLDSHWTVEAISNIVKNCMEHTGEGGAVTLSAWQNNFSTNIRIQDNGEGISPEHLPHIFERFYKADISSKSSVGIGLAMSKKIVLLQNGDITVRSTLGKGTEFLVKFYSGVQI